MNELLMQLLGFGGGGQFQNPTNYGPPSGGYGQQTPPQQQYIGNNPNVGFTDPGGRSPGLNQNYPGMMPLANMPQLGGGPNDAGGNKGGRPDPVQRGRPMPGIRPAGEIGRPMPAIRPAGVMQSYDPVYAQPAKLGTPYDPMELKGYGKKFGPLGFKPQ
jgi:hypothetical protein